MPLRVSTSLVNLHMKFYGIEKKKKNCVKEYEYEHTYVQ